MRPEENELLTRVGRGTPGGELLRRYWQPVAAALELTEQKPIKAIKILGEELVVYRDKSGRYGMMAEQCPHRHASLAYGSVDAEGIRCRYHGWKFSGTGRCLESPAEKGPADITHTAYPVQELGGMLFGYMGPLPAPALPRWDVLAWERGERWIERHSVLRCNWFQAMENSVDPAHLFWLHGESGHLVEALGGKYGEEHDFTIFDRGIMKRRTAGAPGKAQVDQHPLLFPNVLRHVFKPKTTGKVMHNLQYRVPIDDTHTQVFLVMFNPNEAKNAADPENNHFSFVSMTDENGDYKMDMVLAQDVMAWETQGPIFDRTTEYLGASDRGIVILRRLMRQQIEAVQAGKAPLGIEPAGSNQRVIELDVINERIGLAQPQTEAAA
jgi:5,5'-dehydrodivanillate O-demethylase